MKHLRLLSVTAAAVVLSACGSDASDSARPLDGKSGTEVAAAAADALEEAGSAHVQGTTTQDGQETTVDADLDGEDAAGSLTLAGTQLDFISAGGTSYFRTAADFWISSGVPADVAAQLHGEWVALPPDATGSSGATELSLSGIVASLRDPESPVHDDVDADELDGQDVVVVTQDDGSELFVASDDPTYPLQLTNAGDAPGSLRLSDFGADQDIMAPEGALDLAQLTGE